jgi:hypothetical protein
MKPRTSFLYLLLVATLAGCSALPWSSNPLASICAETSKCYKLDGPAQAECLARCDRGR